MLLVGGVRGTADVHMIWSPPLLIPSNAHPPKRHHQRQQWKYHHRWRFAGKTGGHVLALKTTDLKKVATFTTHTHETLKCVLPVWTYTLFILTSFSLRRHLLYHFITSQQRLGRLHPSATGLPSLPYHPPPPPPSLTPHCTTVQSQCRHTAAVQQGRSDITASFQPIICFVYFKQHLLLGQWRTCFFYVATISHVFVVDCSCNEE